MKRFFISIFLVVATTALASNPIVEQFINGSGLIITNGSTLVWNQVNIPVYDYNAVGGLYQGQPSKLFYSLTTSNMVPTIVSNASSGWSPGDLYFTNRSAYSSTAPASGGIVVNTNIISPAAWSDVPGWCNGNGDVGQGCISISGVNDSKVVGTVLATNSLTFVFAPIVNGTNAVTYNGATMNSAAVENIDKLTLVLGLTNNVANTIRTNLPALFMAGSQKIRLVSIVSAASGTGTNCTVKYITASGFSSP